MATLADTLERERKKKQPVVNKRPQAIQFVRAGEKMPATQSRVTGLLQGAPSWEMRVDLHRKLVFPDVVQTNLRPDIVLWSSEFPARQSSSLN